MQRGAIPSRCPKGRRIQGYLAFYWDLMDAWYREEQQVYAHARDPYKRVDILPSSRHVRVVLGGVTIAETHRPCFCLRRGCRPATTFLMQDMRMEFLVPTETTTCCPYKGRATYWSARIGEQVFKDIVWSYQEPLPECTPIAHYPVPV